MSRFERYRPVVLLRGILLAALALFLGGVVAVFLSNRMSTDGESERPADNTLDSALAELLLVGKGFDFEVTDGDKRLYHISADRILANRDNEVTLEGIVLAVEREDGEVYRLAAEKGIYRSDSNSAEVQGNVVLTGPDGVEVRGQEFDLMRKGTVVKSHGPVEFSAGKGTSGTADELEAYLKKDLFQLNGEVRLTRRASAEDAEFALEADRIVYDKSEGLIHAEGGVRLRNGRDRMSCDRIAVTLAGEGEAQGERQRFVRARWNVVGSLVSSDPLGFDRELRFTGEEASIAYGRQGSEPRTAEIAGSDAKPAVLISSDETGLGRRFSSRRIEASFARGELREVRTGGAMILTEFLLVAPGRDLAQVCGASATVKFDSRGDLARFEVGGGADLHRSGFQARGETLIASGKNKVEVIGEPANVFTRDGELSAPKISHDTDTGKVVASGGVRALLPPRGGFTMVKGTNASDDLPIQVTAESANWDQQEGRFEFEKDVRAWQGESFLTASRLIGENDGRVRGEGGVQTTLERGSGKPRDTDEQIEGPVRVTADSFEYTKSAGLIEYRGGPEVRDAGRLMSCDELAVFLLENSDLDRLECRGNALIDDRVGGRKVRGSLAVYRPEDSQVEVTGNPVTLERPDGSAIRASRVLYDFETTTARFQSASSTDTEPGGGQR